MSVEAVTEITNKALYLIIKVSMPILLVSLIIGLVVSIFQTVTSIQESSRHVPGRVLHCTAHRIHLTV